MNSPRKPLSLLIALPISLGSLSAGAVGLGDLTAGSRLGEPLRAEIRLLNMGGAEFDPACVRRASTPDDDLPWVRSARFRVAGNKLIVTTREPLNHPIAMLGVQLGCENPVRRDYPILLQPPVGRNADVSPPEAAPAQPVGTPAAASPRQARPRATTAPEIHASSAMPAPPRQPRPRRPDHPQAQRPVPSGSDRLILGSGAEAGLAPLRMSLLLSSPPSGDEADGTRQALRQEQRTLAEIDDRISAQLEVDEKIRRLEEYQKMLKERVAQLDQHKPVSPASAPPSPPTAAAQPPALDTLLGTLKEWGPAAGGVAAVVAGLGALAWMRRRRKAEEAEMTTEPAFETDIGASAPPHTTVNRPKREEPAEMRAMPPVQHSVAPMPPADTSAEWVDPTFAPPHPIPFDETVDEQDSALELAEIMMSFGRTQGAAETLADYIRNNPRQAVKPWLKLLDVYHVAGMRAEFEALTRQLNKTFNVKMVSWNDFKAVRTAPADSVEQMPHIIQRLQELWGTQEAQAYIHQILRDNRDGTRQGFPLSVVEELLLLLSILDSELGAYEPPSEEPALEPMVKSEPDTELRIDF